MYGYVKTIRLCLAEYLIALILHTVFAFFKYGSETGWLILLISSVAISITFLFSVFIKSEKIVIAFTYFSVVIATTAIGYILNTLAFSIVIFLAVACLIGVFMEALYVILGTVISLIAIAGYLIICPEKILCSVDSLGIYFVYIALFCMASLNLYTIIYHAKNYMTGMEEKAKDAELANESKMIFLANMSHEIRTPMNAICGMAELTLRQDGLPEEARENLNGIQKSGRVLISIVNDILDYSKLESGNMEIIPVTYSLKMVLDDVLNLMSVRIDEKDITIDTDIQQDLPNMLIGDEIRIRQILFNILSNAIKYTEKGFVFLKVEGKVDGGFVDLTISVTDSGIGIKKEDMPKLFTSFQQLDTHRSLNREGTGLGLAVVKQLLDFMGGDISVESTYGVGSKFTIHISQKISEDSDERDVLNRSDEPRVSAPDAYVLVVDDNAVNLKVAEGLLKTFGIKVDTVLSGRECLETLKTNKKYDMIFMDHMMPELDGIETLKLIRSDSDEYMQSVPVVALTANVVSGVRDMFIEAGFDDYVPKPIDMIWLNGILKKYIPVEKQH